MGGRAAERFFAAFLYLSSLGKEDDDAGLTPRERIRRKQRAKIATRPAKFGTEMWFWRPVLGELATRSEVRSWSLRDLVECHTLLDARDELTEYDRRAAKQDAGR